MSKSEVQVLAEIIRGDLKDLESRLNHRIDAAMSSVRDELHAVGGRVTVQLERLTIVAEGAAASSAHCANRIMVVEADTRALTDRFLPKAENERRHRASETAIADLEKARDEVRGRVDDIEHQLQAVQAGRHRS